MYAFRLARFERQAEDGLQAVHQAIARHAFSAAHARGRELDAHLRQHAALDATFAAAAESWLDRARRARTVALRMQEASELRLQLSGIVFGSDERPIAEAIVNGRIVRAEQAVGALDGTPIDGLIVTAVERYSVRFGYRGIAFRVFLGVEGTRDVEVVAPELILQ